MNGNLLIKNAAEVVTCSGFEAKQGAAMNALHIITDGAVRITGGRIQQVGPTAEIDTGAITADDTVIDATGCCVLPGFVDPHTHFVFGGYRPEEFVQRLEGQSYMQIMQQGGGIARTVAATRAAGAEELYHAGRQRLDTLLANGVTTVEGKSGYGLDKETELKQLDVMARLQRDHPVDVVPTFLGAHAVLPEYKGREDDFIDFLIDDVLPAVVQNNRAKFCDVFCEAKVFSVAQSRRLLQAAQAAGLKARLHADEIVALGGAELAAELKAVSADHLLQVSDEGIRQMAAAGVVATLLPATAFNLREPFAPARKLIDNGCAVALATDLNPGSSFTASIPLLIALATLEMKMTIAETVTALTLNAAAAVGRAGDIGSLDPGKAGDLAILNFPSHHFLAYHLATNCVGRVIKNGRVVHGPPPKET